MGEMIFPAWDPVLLELPGPFDLRWYGLMYVVAFLAGNYILTRLARSGFLPLPPAKVGDLILSLILGVILGGRIGWILFYALPAEPGQGPLSHWWEVFKIWEGGLSFHGGLLGVAVVGVWFAKRNRISVRRLGDCLALATPPGILAVRMANFINGELYGRIIGEGENVPWAMRFPTDPRAQEILGIQAVNIRERELQTLAAFENGTWEEVIASGRVPLRHPSQIYEGLAEGLLLGLILWLLYATCRKRLGAGALFGTFLLGYGLFRFGIEFFRQPDTQFQKQGQAMGTVLGPFSMGQILCFLMILVGSLFFWFQDRNLRGPVVVPADQPADPAQTSQTSQTSNASKEADKP